MKKKIFLTFLALALVIGAILGIKALQILNLIKMGKSFEIPSEAVVLEEATMKTLMTEFKSVGTIEAARGVTIANELPGKVVAIDFQSGSEVKAGQPLVQLDRLIEEAQLRSARATAELQRQNYERIAGLRRTSVVSQSDMENAEAQAKDSSARVDQLVSLLEKKVIRAPFDGRLGIRQIQVGQFLKSGDPIVSLQATDPVFVNFSLPQQRLVDIKPGMKVVVTTDALPGREFIGELTAIEPEVDAATRNIRLQATLQNKDGALRQGMFVAVSAISSEEHEAVVIPATAVLFAPYGNSVFVAMENEDEKGKYLAVEQRFVRLGKRTGDFVAVEEGLLKGDRVVTSGGFKLRNGAKITQAPYPALPSSTNPAPVEK